MKYTKKLILPAIVLITILSFTKAESSREVLKFNNIDAISLLAKQELGARPSSKYMFYVDTELVKKSRGYSLVKASIYLYERTTGKYNLLATEKIISPIHKDTFLDYEIAKYNSSMKLLENGDKIFNSEEETLYSFNELMTYKTIYNSYIISKNKLLEKK